MEQRLERDKQLGKEYEERFEIFADHLKQWEETEDRVKSVAELRTLLEAEYPDVRKEREDKERCDRAERHNERLRGEDERAHLARKQALEKAARGVADVPRLLTAEERKMDEFVERPGAIIENMKYVHRKSILDRLERWTPEDRALFKSRCVEHVKIFHGLTQFFIDKSPSDLVLFYYMNKKTEDYKKDFKQKKRAAKYKVAPFPSKEELAYLRQMAPLDYSKYPKNSLTCMFCCKTVNGVDLDGTFLPEEAYDVWAVSHEEDRIVCCRCREEMTKMYKDNRCLGNRCVNKRKTRMQRSTPPDLFDVPIRTRAFLMDQIGVPRVAIKLCAACRNYVNKCVADIHAREPTILDELSRYEGQVGWTDQEKTKLVSLINASASLDWDVISAGMNRRPNECKMQYDALNGNKGQQLIEEVDEEMEATGNDDVAEAPSAPTPTTSSRRSGLARSVKKAPKTPRVARNSRRTAGAVTRAQAKPALLDGGSGGGGGGGGGHADENDEMEDVDEEASNTSGGGKSGSKAASDNDSSPQGSGGQHDGDDSSGGADDDDEEMPSAATVAPDDEPMLSSPTKTLIETPTILSPKVLIQPPDFSTRVKKPSTTAPTASSSSSSSSSASAAAPNTDVVVREETSTSGESSSEPSSSEEPSGESAAAAPPPPQEVIDVVGPGDELQIDVQHVEEKEEEVEVEEEEEDVEPPPAKKPLLVMSPAAAAAAPPAASSPAPRVPDMAPPIIVAPAVSSPPPPPPPPVTLAAPTPLYEPPQPPPTAQPTPVIASSSSSSTAASLAPIPQIAHPIASPVAIIQQTLAQQPQQQQQIIHHPQPTSTPAQIHTPTPVRPTAASTPSTSSSLTQQQQQQPAMDSMIAALLKQQQVQAQHQVHQQALAALVLQQQQHQQQQQQAQGSLTAGTPFQAAAAAAAVAVPPVQQQQQQQQQQQRAAGGADMEAMIRLLTGGAGANPDIIKLYLQMQIQNQANNPMHLQQLIGLYSQQQLVAQAQAAQVAQAAALAEAKAKEAQEQAAAQAASARALAAQQAQAAAAQAQAQAQAQQAQQAAARQAAIHARMTAANVQMPAIGINTAYQKSLTPSEPSTSNTPPAHRPRAATTIGGAKAHRHIDAGTIAMNAHMATNVKRLMELQAQEQELIRKEHQIKAMRETIQPETLTLFEQILREHELSKKAKMEEIEQTVRQIANIVVIQQDLTIYEFSDPSERKALNDLVNTPLFCNIMKQLQTTQEVAKVAKMTAAVHQQHHQQQQQQQHHQQHQHQQHQQLFNAVFLRQMQQQAMRHQPQYPGVVQPPPQPQPQPPPAPPPQQQHHIGQKRKMGSMKRAGAASQAASSQASPASVTAATPIGINPAQLALYQQQRAEAEKQQMLQLFQFQQAAASQAQAAHAAQMRAQEQAQQELKSKRKSGIESIQSMQTAAPHRHVPLTGPRMQGGRGVSPALSTQRTATSGRSITAGTSGHSMAPSTTAEFTKEMSDVMQQINKSTASALPPQKSAIAIAAAAGPSNAVSPANTNNSDEIEIVYSGPKISRKLQPVEQPRTSVGRVLKNQLAEHSSKRPLMPEATTEEEATDCLGYLLNEEQKIAPPLRLVTNMVLQQEAMPSVSKTFYLEIYMHVRHIDEDRVKKIVEAAESQSLENRQVVPLPQMPQMPHMPSAEELRRSGVNPAAMQLFQQMIQMQMAQQVQAQQAQAQAQQAQQAQAQQAQSQPPARPDNYEKFQLLRTPHEIARPIATTASPFANIGKATTSSAGASAPTQLLQPPVVLAPPTSPVAPVAPPPVIAAPVAQRAPSAQPPPTSSAPPPPVVIQAPVPVVVPVVAPIPIAPVPQVVPVVPVAPVAPAPAPAPPATSSGPSVMPLNLRVPASTPQPQPSPSVAVQTASPSRTPSAPAPEKNNPPSVCSIGPSDVSSDEDESNKTPIPKNRLPPGKDSKQLRSIIDLRAEGIVPCKYSDMLKENLLMEKDQQTKMLMQSAAAKKMFSKPCRPLVYEDLSDDE